MKKVDRKLLQKYYAGLCSEEEKKQVEAWLASGHYDEPLSLSDEDKNEYKDVMWRNIMEIMENTPRKIDPKPGKMIPLYKKIARYAAVACVLVALGLVLNFLCSNFWGSQQTVAKYNTTSDVDRFQLADIKFLLTPNAQVSVKTNSCNNSTQINFSGHITFTNEFSDDMQYTFISANGAKRTVTLKKGVTYYVFTSKDLRTGEDKINTYDKRGVLLRYDLKLVPKMLINDIMLS